MKFVFCEGKDDVAVVEGVAQHLGLGVNVEQYGGRDNLSNFLESLPKRPEFAQQKVTSIAVLRDADLDSAAAFRSVHDTLLLHGFGAPDVEGHFSDSMLRVGIFIIGVNGKRMIEDLCLESVSGHPGFSCVNSYFDCVLQNSTRKQFSSKARVRVWMASQVDYEYHVGKAAEGGYWRWENSAFDLLKGFLVALSKNE